MKRFSTLAAIVAISLVLPLGCATPATSTSSSLSSVYDGTYAGTFTYEYVLAVSNGDGSFALSNLVQESFTLTMTLKTVSENGLMTSCAVDSTGAWASDTSSNVPAYSVQVTNVQCSDPDFGPGGAPGRNPNDSLIGLPMQASGTYDETLYFYFPNGSLIGVNAPFSVTNGGETLSSTIEPSAVALNGFNESWWPDILVHGVRYSNIPLDEPWNEECDWAALSWSLTKQS